MACWPRERTPAEPPRGPTSVKSPARRELTSTSRSQTRSTSAYHLGSNSRPRTIFFRTLPSRSHACCGTYPTPAAPGSLTKREPSYRPISPSSSWSSALLPEPRSPQRTQTVPWRTVRLIRLSGQRERSPVEGVSPNETRSGIPGSLSASLFRGAPEAADGVDVTAV